MSTLSRLSTKQTTSNLAELISVGLCVEYDDEIRTCNIKLYTRPIQISEMQEDRPSARNENEGSSKFIALHHWAMVFNFGENDRILTFEAVQNENGMIEAYRSHHRKVL